VKRRGNCLIVLLGLTCLLCLSGSALATFLYFELPERGWNKVEACAGLAVGRTRVGVWWTSPLYSPAPAAAYATPYALCAPVLWPPWLVSQGNRTFRLPWAAP
jgi:hypothetical protein